MKIILTIEASDMIGSLAVKALDESKTVDIVPSSIFPGYRFTEFKVEVER